MKKQFCVIDFCVRGEETSDPYVERAELKDSLTCGEYSALLCFLLEKKIHQRREGVSSYLLKEFFERQS